MASKYWIRQYLKSFQNVVRISKFSPCLIFILLVGIFLTYVNVRILEKTIIDLNLNQFGFEESSNNNRIEQCAQDGRRTARKIAWIFGKTDKVQYLRHVFRVFERLGYSNMSSRSASDQWDIIWSHEYPFVEANFSHVLQNMKPHQLVNHIPGSGFYTSKVLLATSNLTGIPVAFKLPTNKANFTYFAQRHPGKLWIQKNDHHRGIKLLKFTDINLNKAGTFVQEYIANPLLIDGRKFDIGVYTVILSVDPLIVYTLSTECMFRLCSKDYHPFNANDLDKYVIGDEYTPVWQVPSLAKYYNMSFSRREAFNAYVHNDLAKNPDTIWHQVSEIIRNVLLSKKPKFMEYLSEHRYPLNFFELSRFDFVVDENLNVYLMEANMSPNLSSDHFPANKLIYEQVIFNLASLLGLAISTSDHLHSLSSSNLSDTIDMIVSDREISVYPERCSNVQLCRSCNKLVCKLCQHCLTVDKKWMLKKAFLSHTNRHSMRRILPIPEIEDEDDHEFEKKLHFRYSTDVLIALWFRGKCFQDSSWCS